MSEQQPRTDLPGGGETGRSQPAPSSSTTPTTAAAPPRKKRHWLRWTVVVILLVLVGGALVVYFNLNGIIERTVETQSTNSLNLKTELDSAALALFGGSLSLNDLQIASPPGFSSPNMLELGGVDVAVKYKELRGDPVHISSIAIKKPKLVIEHVNGKVNFKAAMDQLPTPPQSPDRPPAEGKPLKLIIDELTVQEAQVVVRPGLPMLAQEITVPVPTVTLKNIGNAEGARNGAAVKDVVMQVVTVLAAEASDSEQLGQFRAILQGNLDSVVNQLGAEAQKRLAEALPGELGNIVSGLDIDEVRKDPEKALKDAAQQRLGNILGGGDATTTQPGETDGKVDKKIEEGLKGLLNRKERDEK